MTTSRTASRRFGGVLLIAAGALSAASASADPAASSSAPAAPSATPVTSVSVPQAYASAAALPLPIPTGAEIPIEATPTPNAEEWKSAKTVKPNRGNNTRCTLSLKREWLKLRCQDLIGAALVAGDPRGVSITTTDREKAPPQLTTVVLPLTRGEAKIVTFFQENWEGYDSLSFMPAGMLSVVWRAGRPDPMLVMTAW